MCRLKIISFLSSKYIIFGQFWKIKAPWSLFINKLPERRSHLGKGGQERDLKSMSHVQSGPVLQKIQTLGFFFFFKHKDIPAHYSILNHLIAEQFKERNQVQRHTWQQKVLDASGTFKREFFFIKVFNSFEPPTIWFWYLKKTFKTQSDIQKQSRSTLILTYKQIWISNNFSQQMAKFEFIRIFAGI